MMLSITTHCATPERLSEIRALATRLLIDHYLIHPSQLMRQTFSHAEQDFKVPEACLEEGKTRLLGMHGLLEASPGLAIVAAQSIREQSAAVVNKLAMLTSRLGGSYLILASDEARELPSRATSSEIHAMLAEFFELILPAVEAWECQVILDVPKPKEQHGHPKCLSKIEDIIRFLNYFKHPCLHLGLRSSAVEQIPDSLELVYEQILPLTGMLIIDDLELGQYNARKLLEIISRAKSQIPVCMETPANLPEPVNSLKNLIPQLRKLSGA